MKTFFSIFSLLLAFSFTATAALHPVNTDKDLEGVYTYTAKEAPYEYQNGTFEIKKEKDDDQQDIWTAQVTISGYSMTARDVKVNNSKIQFRVYVEGTPVTVNLEQKEGQLIGSADSYEGPISIIAKKKIEEKE